MGRPQNDSRNHVFMRLFRGKPLATDDIMIDEARACPEWFNSALGNSAQRGAGRFILFFEVAQWRT